MKDPTWHRWIMLALAFLIAFTLHFFLFSYSPMVSRIMSEMGLSYAQAALVFSICIFTIVLLRIPWGLLSDRIGFATTMKLAMAFICVFGLLRGFATNYATLLIFQFLLGVGFAAVLPCLPKLVDSWFHEKVGLATGLYAAGFPIGDMAGVGLTPYLLASIGNWRNVFIIYGVWGLILTALWWTLAKEPAKNKYDALTHRTRLNTSLKEDFAKLLKVRDIWILTGLCICAMGCYDTILTWLPSMLKNVPSETAGLMASMLSLGFLLASPTIGTLSDKIGLRKPFIWILGLISGPAILAIALFSGSLQWVAIFTSGFCTAGIITIVLVIPTELPDVAQLMASAVGFISSIGNVGPFLFPIAVGYIKDVTQSFLPAMIMLAIIAETALILGLMMKETGIKLKEKQKTRITP